MQLSDQLTDFSFLAGGGEMGALTRAYDWGATSLGQPGQWPQSLRTTVSLMLTSKFPMFLWWGEELIQFYNDAYRPSFGQVGKHPRALGQPGAACWPEIWPVIQPLIEQVLRSREAVWREDQLIPIYRNGQLEDVYWTFSYSPVMSEANEIGGVLVIVQETTQKAKAWHQIKQQTIDLQRSNANLQLFASAASHDLQEPLRKIQQFGVILRTAYGARLDEEGNNIISRMEGAAGRMSRLIAALLTYSQLVTHSEPFRKKELNPIIDHVLRELDTVIQQKQAQIDIAPLGTLRGDATQLGQLFQNLLSNALKFTKPDETPHIIIDSHPLGRSELPSAYQSPAGHELFCTIRVVDNGIGFEQAQAKRIFDTFHRLHGRNQFPGTGLGLAIVKRVVENHQGYIMAESQLGQGAIFTIYLPV